jgi:hypothetical protein
MVVDCNCCCTGNLPTNGKRGSPVRHGAARLLDGCWSTQRLSCWFRVVLEPSERNQLFHARIRQVDCSTSAHCMCVAHERHRLFCALTNLLLLLLLQHKDPSATIGEGCLIGPNVVIGQNCEIRSGMLGIACLLQRCNDRC